MPGYAFKYNDQAKPKVVNLRKEPHDVYIGRKSGRHLGKWGNPVIRGRVCPVCGGVHHDNESIVKCYKRWLWHRIQKDPDFRKDVRGLAGKTLGCFCKPKPCHGDVLAAACAWLIEQEKKES